MYDWLERHDAAYVPVKRDVGWRDDKRKGHVIFTD